MQNVSSCVDGDKEIQMGNRVMLTFCTPVQKLCAILDEVFGDVGDLLELIVR